METIERLLNLKSSLQNQVDLSRVYLQCNTGEHWTPEKKEMLLHSCEQIEQLYSPLEESVKVALSNPKSAEAQSKLDSVVQQAKDLSAILMTLTYPDMESRIQENGIELEKSLRKLTETIKKGDEKQTTIPLRHVSNRIYEQALLGSSMAKQSPSDSSLTQQILESSHELDETRLKIAETTAIAVSDVKQQPAFQELSLEIMKHNQQLIGLVKENVNFKIEKKRREEEEEEKLRQEEQQKLLEAEELSRRRQREEKEAEEQRKEIEESNRKQQEEEAERRRKQDEVSVAAQSIVMSVNKATNKLGSDFLGQFKSEGKLFDTARHVGELMAFLAEASEKTRRSEMIKYAKEIAESVKSILKEAEIQASKCTDSKLKQQLLNASQAANNFAVQLKIITAVKAAGDEDVHSTRHIKYQLIKCAKSLSVAIVNTVQSAEIAAIRIKTS